MASTAVLDDLEIDYESILAQSEARLAAKDTVLTIAPKLEVPTVVPQDKKEPAPQANELSLRVPKLEQKSKKGVKDDAGSQFFHMPRTNLTPELKRDLQLLRMRSVLANGKQHFKKDTRKDPVPEFSQVGRLISGDTDGTYSRLTRKEQKQSIVEEVLGGDGLDKFKNKYNVIQERKTSGKKAHYKKLVARRRRG